MRRLENEDEEKFWEAWIKDDLIFCYRYGKIGAAGHTKLKKFKTKAEAEAELEAKLAEKLEEGFAEPGAEDEEEAEEEEAEEEEDESDDEDEDEDESEDEEEDESDDEEDEDEAPRKKARATAPIVVEAPPAKPSLPPRVRAATSAPKPERLAAVVKALDAVREAAAGGARSWRLARLARRARHALSALGGAPLGPHEAVNTALDAVMDAVGAPKPRLPLEDALTLLWVVDVATYARIVARWRAKTLDPAVSPAIGVLAAAIATIPDPEVALHVGTALVNRRLSPDAFQYWFSRLKPFLVETGGFDALRAALKPGSDAILRGRTSEVVP